MTLLQNKFVVLKTSVHVLLNSKKSKTRFLETTTGLCTEVAMVSLLDKTFEVRTIF